MTHDARAHNDPDRYEADGPGRFLGTGPWPTRAPRLVILTAATSEYTAVREFLTPVHATRSSSGAPYSVGNLATTSTVWEAWVTCIGQGNIAAALQASQAVQELRPALIAFVGTAGSLKADVGLGDVVFATKVYGYESARQTDEGLMGRPSIEVADRTLVQLAFRVAAEGVWHEKITRAEHRPAPVAHVAPIAAGDKLHTGNRSALHAYLKASFDDAHAVEMEGLGFLTGARFWPTETHAVLVRGISDRLFDKEPGQDAMLQPAACRNAMAFLAELLDGYPQLPDAPRTSIRRRFPNPPTFIPLPSESGGTFIRRDEIPSLALVGEIIDGRYRLVREIGRGALNVVWEAEEFAFGNPLGRVALKLQPPQGDKRYVYFSREAMVMAGLDSPNLLPYRSAGTQEGGALNGWSYICTALAELSLRDAISEQPLWGSDLLEMLRDVAAGLCHLHTLRLVHGDVKPANILKLGSRWVIGDFGLTQRTGASEPEGTVGYMAPERFNGQVRTKNDVYSFAVTAAVAVSGDQRNENSTVEDTQLRMMHILAGDIPKPPFFPSGRLPPPVYEIICQAFSENPAERPAMEEILALLHAGDPTNAVSAPRSQARHARGQWRFRGL
ncbi:hypothetical protein DF268_19450 [Streptomyces sp. V2]|uniref:Protein kinase domain-containing protein n=1 Tax=Streptomyces niveiscabiei TaxID=164115 RepID=A0ABW9HZ21_9ACTN|nr:MULTISPECIES: protein kinase [Streptomyces]PWG11928.1 hypothetical protein DF268_19450 [Streptomyces sp. V2]